MPHSGHVLDHFPQHSCCTVLARRNTKKQNNKLPVSVLPTSFLAFCIFFLLVLSSFSFYLLLLRSCFFCPSSSAFFCLQKIFQKKFQRHSTFNCVLLSRRKKNAKEQETNFQAENKRKRRRKGRFSKEAERGQAGREMRKKKRRKLGSIWRSL